MKITLALLLAAFLFTTNNHKSASVFISPVSPDFEIVSDFGMRTHPILNTHRFHSGVDFNVPVNTTVFAAADGVVSFVGETEVDGLKVIITHENGFETEYAHLSAFNVETGRSIKQGDEIAKSGQTGIAQNVVLHFSIKKDGEFVDPEGFIYNK